MSCELEADLVARCRRGSEEAWNELFDLHYAATARFIFQLSPDLSREDTEELCQEVFLSVVKHLRSFNGASRLQTWIFRIAVNEVRDHCQRRQAAKRGGGVRPLSLQLEDPETGRTLDPPGPERRPDQELIAGEDRTLLGRALEALARPYREVVMLRYFGDLSYQEIAAALHLKPKTVASRLSKSLDRLESILNRLSRGKERPGPQQANARLSFGEPAHCNPSHSGGQTNPYRLDSSRLART